MRHPGRFKDQHHRLTSLRAARVGPQLGADAEMYIDPSPYLTLRGLVPSLGKDPYPDYDAMKKNPRSRTQPCPEPNRRTRGLFPKI